MTASKVPLLNESAWPSTATGQNDPPIRRTRTRILPSGVCLDRLIDQGIDPHAERDARRDAPTFLDLVEEWRPLGELRAGARLVPLLAAAPTASEQFFTVCEALHMSWAKAVPNLPSVGNDPA